jgi:hypothetical protein
MEGVIHVSVHWKDWHKLEEATMPYITKYWNGEITIFECSKICDQIYKKFLKKYSNGGEEE